MLGTPRARLLLVEDERELSRVIVDWLGEELYIIDVAYDGMEALEKINLNKYDLIILDLIVPIVSGTDICSCCRAQGIKTPILVLTANTSWFVKKMLIDEGANVYMTKPFKLHDLSLRISDLLANPNSVLPGSI
jgi:DNA-binding response OmpR family regulator